MFYDVSVTRTSTATKTIRVEADSAEEAEDKAVEQAHDEDYTGCVVEYDFDAGGATEAREGLDDGLDAEEETSTDNPKDDPDEGDVKLVLSPEKKVPEPTTCTLCGAVMPDDISQAIEDGWIPTYWVGDEDQGNPVCPACDKQFIVMEDESVLNLKGEYVSVWDGGRELRSPCTVDPRTRKVVIELTQDATVKVLDREYVLLNGKEYEGAFEEERDDYTKEEQSRMFFWD